MDRRVLALALLALALVGASASVDASGSPSLADATITGRASGTDATSGEREALSMSGSRAKAEKHVFQAEVNRLMDILIHSLYSNKDIFLRELISNASDALDKIRFLSLTEPAVLGDDASLDIQISHDKDARTLTIRDRGVGMTKEELIKNLGTIAKSGTSAFLETMQKGGDINLIGQFGVGFYSVYLVADRVEVVSKAAGDTQHVWESAADGAFSIREDSEGEQLGRGTLIRIHLKEEAADYADEAKLRALVGRYSEFINFPIYLWTTKEVEVPVEAAEPEDAKGDEPEDEAADAEEDETGDENGDGEAAAPPKTRKESRSEWERLNDNKALWLRKPSEVTDEEYQKFYKAVSKDYGDALGWSHFKAEGDVEFRAMLFIPATAPYQFYEKYYEKAEAGLKLYVRRVFISDDVDDLLPRYLTFLKGLVDSDTLPLNVSREMLQAHAALKTIKKKLVRKALDMIRELSDNEAKCKAAAKAAAAGDAPPADEPAIPEAKCKQYGQFWEQYGRAIKLGMIEDGSNRLRLAKLLRVKSSASGEEYTTLDAYIERMKAGQKDIYYLAGGTTAELAASPLVESLLARGYEVLYFTDVLDEYVMQHMQEYDDKKFVSLAKEDAKLSADDETQLAAATKALREQFRPLAKWWKKALGDKAAKVRVSTRLASTPCVVLASKYGQSANMERIMKAQAFGDPSRAQAMKGGRTLEINPRHPLVRALAERMAADEADAGALAIAKVMFDTALLDSGFQPDDAKALSRNMYDMVRLSLGVDSMAEVSEAEAAAAADAAAADAAVDAVDADADADADVKQEL